MEGIPPEDAKEHERQKAGGGGIVTGGADDQGYHLENHIFVANSSTAILYKYSAYMVKSAIWSICVVPSGVLYYKSGPYIRSAQYFTLSNYIMPAIENMLKSAAYFKSYGIFFK